MMKGLLFFDIEVVRQPKERIRSIGAWLDGRSWHALSVQEFETFSREAILLCGHNIFAHDLPFLEKAGISADFLQRNFIDTLFLSALLFPNKPYHRLIKDYQLMSEHLNDPVEDAKLARELFADCVGAYLSLPGALQFILRSLLVRQREFSSFFGLLSPQGTTTPEPDGASATAPEGSSTREPQKSSSPRHNNSSSPESNDSVAPKPQESSGSGLDVSAALKPHEASPPTPGLIREKILAYFGERICRHADLETLIREQAVPLAYALALIDAPDQSSVIPPWLLHRFPELTNVLQQLRGNSCGQASCSYCRENLSAEAGLRRYFAYPHFRKFSEQEAVPLQQLVVEAALRGESLLAIFPTGGGKSLSFQLPALMKGAANRGLTVVISPLQALMKDQVDVLASRFDISSAIAINGLLSPLERADAIRQVREGGVSLLYISPESLRSNTILKLLKGRHIERFVIDEAHCFSSWGQDFRVDYLYIGRFLRQLAEAKQRSTPIPVSCFTATAKPEVVQDILQYFREQAGVGLQLYQTSAPRTNLSYHASRAEGKEKKLLQLNDLLQEVSEPVIVYVSRTKTAVQLAESLKKSGFKAEAFHGRMASELKIRTQDSFMQGETNIIVATSAFGMGVDKENVKMVVHYDISDSLENYLQEAGRAGRKAELEADCHLLFDENDLNEHFALLNQTKLSKKEIGQVWKAVKDFKRSTFTKSALEIARQAGWETDMRDLETAVKAAIAALEDVGYLRREQNSPRIFAQSILVRKVEEANKIISSHADRFPGKQQQEAVRIYQYLISREDTLIDYLADDLGIAREVVVRILLHFKELGLLGDTRDLTALVDHSRSKKNSERCCRDYVLLERALLEALFPTEDAPTVLKLHLREINEKLLERGCEDSSVEAIRKLLQYWEHQHYIRKERIDAHTLLYRIEFRQERSALYSLIEVRTNLATAVAGWLSKENSRLLSSGKQREEAALSFSMMEMKQQLETSSLLLPDTPLTQYEAVLLYLHFIGAIKLEGGLFVLYNPMTIVRQEENQLKQYTRQDYAKLERHYEKKVEQIHIMGEYARRQLRNHVEALHFVNDYFSLGYEAFIDRHFRGQKGKLKRPITEKKFREIFGKLSEEQLAVVKDKEHEKILVGAGPGSGKTRVLVHKVAALLMMEDIKPEQFLMLTFSRPAAAEFKERLQQLIGRTAYHIDIFTYHGFAFQLLGRVGDLKKSDNVIGQATEALQKEEIAADRVKSKSVIVVDEYQDISRQEYDFLQQLTTLADEVRVIVVGDDDQNVYEFRGSSVAFMRSFVEEQKAKQYLLSRNYRACFNLVAFSNAFLSGFRSDRLKAGLPLLAHSQRNGTLQLSRHPANSSLLIPLVEELKAGKPECTVALLTHTNEEALLAHRLLRQAGIAARLIAGQEGFGLPQLLELKVFTLYLYEAIKGELGLISAISWKNCRQRIEQQFAQSADLPLALEVIHYFEAESGGRMFWSEWRAYLAEIRVEDFVYPEATKVLVSTMHKAKGKEFDHVFLLLQRYPLLNEARKRVVYVAITRARQSLYIHTDGNYFDQISVPALQRFDDPQVYPMPEDLQLELGMSDVWLSFYQKPHTSGLVKELLAGSRLSPATDPGEGLLADGCIAVKYSQKFRDKLCRLIKQGYSLRKAAVAHIVVWYCEEDGKEYRVVLPKIYLQRRLKG